MALFADGPAPTIDDLANEDSGLLEVAENTGINLTVKLRFAHEELGTDLKLWLGRHRLVGDIQRAPFPRIEQIAVTPELKHWETMQTLAMVYRDAYFSAMADRYQAKWLEFVELTRSARERVVASGLAIVNDPVPQPAPPVLGTTPGAYPGGTYYVAVAGVNAKGQEGASSWASSITTKAGDAVLVAPKSWSRDVATFRVYAGPALDMLVKQNSVDLPAGLTYTYLPGQVVTGPLAGDGQKADFVLPLVRTVLRG